MGTQLTTAVKKKVAARIASGEPNASICRDTGVPLRTLYRHLRGENGKGELRKFIEEQTQRLMDAVPDAVDIIRDTIDVSKNCPVSKELEKDTKNRDLNIRLRKIAIDSANDVLKTASIAPTNSQSVHVQALIVGGQDMLSPVIARILGLPQHREDIIDVTPIEDPLFQEETIERHDAKEKGFRDDGSNEVFEVPNEDA